MIIWGCRTLSLITILIIIVASSLYATYAQDAASEKEEFEVKERLVIENFEEPLGSPFEIYESEKGKA